MRRGFMLIELLGVREQEQRQALAAAEAERYPRQEGCTIAIGPECFAGQTEDGTTVICWKGENFVPAEQRDAAEARAVKAEGERDEARKSMAHCEWLRMKDERDAAVARAEGLAEALGFYADEYTYVASCASVDGGTPIEMPNALIDHDQGQCARAALARKEAP